MAAAHRALQEARRGAAHGRALGSSGVGRGSESGAGASKPHRTPHGLGARLRLTAPPPTGLEGWRAAPGTGERRARLVSPLSRAQSAGREQDRLQKRAGNEGSATTPTS